MRIALLTPFLDERYLTAFHRRRGGRRRHACAINLTVTDEEDIVPVGRHHRRTAATEYRDLPRRNATRGADRPDCAFGAARIVRWIGDPSGTVRARSANERHRRAVLGDLDVGEVGAVIVEEVRQADGFEVGCCRSVDVPHATFVRHPGQAIGPGRGPDLERRCRRQELLNRGSLRQLRMRRCYDADCDGACADESVQLGHGASG